MACSGRESKQVFPVEDSSPFTNQSLSFVSLELEELNLRILLLGSQHLTPKQTRTCLVL